MLKLPIHHIGVACRSIEKEWLTFKQLGFIEEDNFIDERQGVRGKFVVNKHAANESNIYRFELLENIQENGVLDSYLANNIKMYHIAYESKNIQQDVNTLLATPPPPMPARRNYDIRQS